MTEKGACGLVNDLASPLFVRMIDRLLPFAQFFIKFQPQAAQVFDNPACFADALHMYIQLLRRDVEPDAIRRLLQETLQTRQREDGFDMGVIESKHQFRGKRPHPVVHDNRIMAVELQTVIDVVERMVEVNHRLRRKLRGQTHVAALAESVLSLFQQFVTLRTERVEMKFGIRIRLGEVDRVFRTLEMIAVAAIQQFALGMGEEEERRRVRFNVTQRHDVKIDVGNLPAAVRHFVTQDAFGLNPIVFRSFPNYDKQVISHRVAVRRATDQFTEQ